MSLTYPKRPKIWFFCTKNKEIGRFAKSPKLCALLHHSENIVSSAVLDIYKKGSISDTRQTAGNSLGARNLNRLVNDWGRSVFGFGSVVFLICKIGVLQTSLFLVGMYVNPKI